MSHAPTCEEGKKAFHQNITKPRGHSLTTPPVLVALPVGGQQIPKTTAFIADGNFRRVALQFPDALLREAPEVLWTLQARLRKLTAGAGPSREHRQEGSGAAAAAQPPPPTPPLIFVTGDTSYGSCCVDEVSAQHLKADAIVHYGESLGVGFS